MLRPGYALAGGVLLGLAGILLWTREGGKAPSDAPAGSGRAAKPVAVSGAAGKPEQHSTEDTPAAEPKSKPAGERPTGGPDYASFFRTLDLGFLGPDADRTRERLEALFRTNPGDAALFAGAMEWLGIEMESAEREKLLRAALEADPDNPLLWSGLLRCLHHGEPGETFLAASASARARFPNNAYFRILEVGLLFKRGDAEAADALMAEAFLMEEMGADARFDDGISAAMREAARVGDWLAGEGEEARFEVRIKVAVGMFSTMMPVILLRDAIKGELALAELKRSAGDLDEAVRLAGLSADAARMSRRGSDTMVGWLISHASEMMSLSALAEIYRGRGDLDRLSEIERRIQRMKAQRELFRGSFQAAPSNLLLDEMQKAATRAGVELGLDQATTSGSLLAALRRLCPRLSPEERARLNTLSMQILGEMDYLKPFLEE